VKWQDSPALLSTNTVCPFLTRASMAAGVSPTLFSSIEISFIIPNNDFVAN